MMDFIRVVFVLIFISLFSNVDSRRGTLHKKPKRNHDNCLPKSLVKYIMTVHTLWSKQTFPKMFPTYRPHAQWSSLVGRTHGSEYHMWEIASNASLGVKLFAEHGDYSQLKAESVQGYNDILDSFVAPPINRSVGQTSSFLFADGRHSKLSFMMKIIPSPDWFIGVSSLDLCARGHWKKMVHADLGPLDAGTDQGLTFTSPNWPNIPAASISAITSSFPDHSASSFMYPEYQKLPRLAYVQLDIVSEYRQGKTFLEMPKHYSTTFIKDNSADNVKNSTNNEISIINAETESTVLIPRYRNAKQEIDNSPGKGKSDNSFVDRVLAVNLDDSDTRQIGQEVQFANDKGMPVVDCQVGKWSEWSSCSHTCGLGQQKRYRNVLRYPENGGANCPLLQQSNVCGSMRNCEFSRFTFLEDGSTKRQLSVGPTSKRMIRTRKMSMNSQKL